MEARVVVVWLALLVLAAGCSKSTSSGSGTGSADVSNGGSEQPGQYRFKSFVYGYKNILALNADGKAFGWGWNSYGQLGNGETQDDRTTPSPVKTEERFVSLGTTGTSSCGLTAAGKIFCWGKNEYGTLGTGDWIDRKTPTPVKTELLFSFLSMSNRSACAIARDSQKAYCWGENHRGFLNVKVDGPNLNVPTEVKGDHAFKQLELGLAYTVCGISTDENIYCWGRNDSSSLFNAQGNPNNDWNTAEPVKIESTQKFRMVSVGVFHMCAVTVNDEPYCWGRNISSVLGTGNAANATVPVPVSGGLKVKSVTADGQYSTCAIATDGKSYCWGNNEHGELGTGDVILHPVPTLVVSPIEFVQLRAKGDTIWNRFGLGTDGVIYLISKESPRLLF